MCLGIGQHSYTRLLSFAVSVVIWGKSANCSFICTVSDSHMFPAYRTFFLLSNVSIKPFGWISLPFHNNQWRVICTTYTPIRKESYLTKILVVSQFKKAFGTLCLLAKINFSCTLRIKFPLFKVCRNCSAVVASLKIYSFLWTLKWCAKSYIEYCATLYQKHFASFCPQKL